MNLCSDFIENGLTYPKLRLIWSICSVVLFWPFYYD